jgi:hypothetical protein
MALTYSFAMIELVLSTAILRYLASPLLPLIHLFLAKKIVPNSPEAIEEDQRSHRYASHHAKSTCDIFNVERITSGDDGAESSVVRSIC